jgi:polysaccharide biosynthesis protein PelG
MAGVGFVLRRLVRADGITTNLSGLAHATLASSGPWLFACLVLISIALIGRGLVEPVVLRQFSVLVMYNFSFSLVGTGVIVLIVTRCLADDIFARDISKVPDLLIGSLTLVFCIMAVIGLALYGFTLDLAPAVRIFGLLGLMLTGGIWLVAVFMSALKSYSSITASFVFGMTVAFFASLLLARPFGLEGLLAGFSLGLMIVFFSMLGRVLVEYPGDITQPFRFLTKAPELWQLGLVGLTINAAIWVDKWIMWFAPGASSLGTALLAHESYEAAMFLAYLSIVPSLALLLVEIETEFFEMYWKFFRQINEHATLSEIRLQHTRVKRILSQGLKRIVLLQSVICLIGLLIAPALVRAVNGGIEMVPVLRYGLVGALFHMLLIATMTVLSYFDLRRELVAVTMTFLVLNASLTALAATLGGEFHGYGYCLAALISFGLAYYLAHSRVNRLLYQTFVANNPTLRTQRA